MGLDNGIVVKSDKRKITRDDLPPEILYPFDEDYNDNPEILYWRKNWGLRDSIVHYLEAIDNKVQEGTYLIRTYYEIFDIVDIIFHFLDKKVWDEEGESIWEYEEVKERLQDDIVNLVLIISFMKENPDIYLEFYDSY